MTHWPRGGYPAANIPASELKPPPANMISKAEQPKYTESDMRVLTEAALRLGRKEAGEEIAVAIEDASAQIYYGDRHQLHEAAEVARQYARDAATSGRTDPTGTPSRPQDSQAGSERLPDPGPPHPWLRLNSEPWLRKGDPNG